MKIHLTPQYAALFYLACAVGFLIASTLCMCHSKPVDANDVIQSGFTVFDRQHRVVTRFEPSPTGFTHFTE